MRTRVGAGLRLRSSGNWASWELASERGRTRTGGLVGKQVCSPLLSGRGQSCICLPKTVLSSCLSSTLSPPLRLPARELPSAAPLSQNLPGAIVDMPSERLLVVQPLSEELSYPQDQTRNTYRTSAGEWPKVPNCSKESNKLPCLGHGPLQPGYPWGLLSCQ